MKRLSLILTLFLMSVIVYSQISASFLSNAPQMGAIGGTMQNPVTWNAYVTVTDGTPMVTLTATIENGWHLYSQNHKGTALPLVISLQSSECYEPLQQTFTEIPEPTEHYDDFLNETELYHSGVVTYQMPLQALCDTTVQLNISVEGQACIDGACVPVEAQLTVHCSLSVIEGQGTRVNGRGESLWWFFLIAFAGGLLGILTPCVFPMIPMTVSYFMKHGGRRQAFFYGFSIVFIYVVVGIVLSAIFGQGFANDISTHWLPNVLFTIIFIVFAISLLGYFEIQLPQSWVNGSAKNEERAGYIGTFFMALTLVLVSFSCTLPIAGAVALGAANGTWIKPIIGMLGFSLAFALPFTLFAIFPQWLNKLPKSGGWMAALKVTLAIVELAFAFKFLSVADQAYQWNILTRDIFLIIWILLFIVLALYMLGLIKFPIDGGNKQKVTKGRICVAILSVLFVIYMIPGLWGAPLNAISGWLPPMNTQHFIEAPEWERGAIMDYDEAMTKGKAEGKNVLVMFTGYGCVNCRKMEQKVLANDKVTECMKSNFIVCTLYVDDKVTELDEPYVTSGNSSITLLGDKNKYIQKVLFNQNAQPCHYIIDPDDESVVAGPMFYETDVDVYLNFLNTKIK
ncbi:MAG: thioredoxin family protein [Paludibacteraceae bacterium]|nr:thioredoxin family protein [Paludibacteraceae bacterium]